MEISNLSAVHAYEKKKGVKLKLHVGSSFTVQQRYSQADFNRFAILSGDDNPIHVDPAFAATTQFGRTAAHGMLLYSSICAAISAQFPSSGLTHLEGELMFTAPTFTNQDIEIQLKVLELTDSSGRIRLSTDIFRPDGQASCLGSVLISNSPGSLPRPVRHEFERPYSESGQMKGLRIGQKASTESVFSDSDLREYRTLTGDENPLLTDKKSAAITGFDDHLVPVGLLGGLISFLLGTALPGPGTMWLKQSFRFWTPAYIGEKLRAEAEVVRLRPEKDLVNLWSSITKTDGSLICSGESLVLVRALQSEL